MAPLRQAAAIAAHHGTALASAGAALFVGALMVIPRPGGSEGSQQLLLWECHAGGGDGGQLVATLLPESGMARTIIPAVTAGRDEAGAARDLAFGPFARE